MRYLVGKDRKRRAGFCNSELDQFIFRAVRRNCFLKSEKVDAVVSAFYRSLPLYSRSTQIKNRCVVTGRASSVISLFRLSRLEARSFFHRGMFFGFRKASW